MAVGTGNGSVYLVDHTLNPASEALITHTLEYVHQLAVSQVYVPLPDHVVLPRVVD